MRSKCGDATYGAEGLPWQMLGVRWRNDECLVCLGGWVNVWYTSAEPQCSTSSGESNFRRKLLSPPSPAKGKAQEPPRCISSARSGNSGKPEVETAAWNDPLRPQRKQHVCGKPSPEEGKVGERSEPGCGRTFEMRQQKPFAASVELLKCTNADRLQQALGFGDATTKTNLRRVPERRQCPKQKQKKRNAQRSASFSQIYNSPSDKQKMRLFEACIV